MFIKDIVSSNKVPPSTPRLFGTLCKVPATLSYPNVADFQVREGLGRWPIFHSFQPTCLPCDVHLKCQKVLKIGP